MGDPNWSDVVFLSGFEGGAAVDEGPLTSTLTLSAGASLSSAQAKFGTQSLLVTGQEHVRTGAMTNALSGTTHFTIEGWYRWETGPTGDDYLVCQGDIDDHVPWALVAVAQTATTARLSLYLDTSGTGGVDQVVDAGTDSTINADTWYFVAADFDGTKYRFYLDGVYVGGSVASHSISTGTAPLCVGAAYSTSGAAFFYGDFDGYADEVRVTAVARYASDSGFTAPVTEFDRGADLDVTVSEGIGVFGASGLGDTFTDTLSQGVGVQATPVWGWASAATDDIGINPVPAVIRAQPASASDTIGVTDALTVYRGVVMLEQLRITLSQVPNHKFQLTASDTTGMAEQLLPALPVALAEGIGVTLVQQAVLSLQVIEALGLLEALAPALLYGQSLSETLGLADVLARFFGGEVSDTVGIESSLLGSAAMPGDLSETIDVTHDELSPQLLVRVTVEDTIDIEAADALSMLFGATLADGIEITAAYLSPGNSVTTWVMNTRSGAVSEYTNFAFNSFAKLGNRYLGASESGLYELLGDDDDGTDIVSRIKSGFAQWAGSRFTMFKAAYLAVRGGGDYVLKITTGDGKSYSYAVSARDMRTTRINIGKGIRTRYFAFELISDGDDYDLDSLEFVPVVTDRRI